MKILGQKQMNRIALNPKRTIARSFTPASGFTLVELLVVIAIIAILAALLLPVLARTKLKATQATCISNQKQLMLAFTMYATENDDKTVSYGGGATGGLRMDGYITPASISWDLAGMGTDEALQALTKMLSKPGVDPLWKYAPNAGVIHCPGDTRYKTRIPGPATGWAYDSYSKTQNLGNNTDDSYANYWGAGASYTTVSSVATPSLTFAFLEDVDSRGYNNGTWVVDWYLTTPAFGHSQSFDWQDGIPMYHGNVSTAAFVDGHAESHAWGDPVLISYGLSIAGGGGFKKVTATGGPDYDYVYEGYRFPGWQE